MDPKIVKKTQDTLGKIIKKPPLTDKLLGKPPFRFLHDIMTSVIKTTGFMQGLFSDTEMNSENVKDKDAKIVFLQKAIDMVCTVTGKDLSAKPVKIVAGHEPERTNEFLQALADAINKNVDNDEFVKRVVKGGKGGGSSKEEKREDKKEKDKLKSEDKKKGRDSEEKNVQDERKQSMDRGDQGGERKRERDREKDRHKEKEKMQDRDKEKDRHGERKHDRDGEKDREKNKERERDSKLRDKSREARGHERDGDRDREKHKERERESKPRDKSREERHRDKGTEKSKKRDQSLDKENESPDRDKMNGDMEEKHEPPTRLQRPASAKGTRRRREGQLNGDDQNGLNEDDEEVTNQRESMIGEGDLPPQIVAARQLARPSSARPAPPRPKQETLESEPAMRLGSGHPTNVIADNDDADDDDDNFLVQETVPLPPDPDLTPLKPLEDHDTTHGALVQKMLDSKKEVERGNQGPAKKTEIERPLISDAQRRKQRESVQKEVDKLRGSIQSLTRSANPLGKVMDYVQEDMDSMQQELDKWKSENAQHSLDLKREMNVTDRAIDPLRQQLAELDRAISDQLDRIAATKSNIIRNDQKIQKMLRGISSS